MAITNARQYLSDRITRVAKPHKILDPAHGPLIAVRLNILTRKTLGGLETNLDSQVIRPDGYARSPACTPRARSPVSAAAACTATTRSRARSSAAASSAAGAAAAPAPSARALISATVSSSRSARSARLGCQLPAATLRRTCSREVAPAITDDTAGCAARPADRDVEQLDAALLRERLQRLDDVEGRRRQPALACPSRSCGCPRRPPRRGGTCPKAARWPAGSRAAGRSRTARAPARRRPRCRGAASCTRSAR